LRTEEEEEGEVAEDEGAPRMPLDVLFLQILG